MLFGFLSFLLVVAIKKNEKASDDRIQSQADDSPRARMEPRVNQVPDPDADQQVDQKKTRKLSRRHYFVPKIRSPASPRPGTM